MKSKNGILVIAALLINIIVMAGGNDPQVSVNNYKHPQMAEKARREKELEEKQDQVVVLRRVIGPQNYKNNFQKYEYTYETVPAGSNQGSLPTNPKPSTKGYKNQFNF